MTYEDVINFALDNLSPEQVKGLYDEWQREAMSKLSDVARPLRRGMK